MLSTPMLRNVFAFVLVLLFGQMAYADPPSITFKPGYPKKDANGNIQAKIDYTGCLAGTHISWVTGIPFGDAIIQMDAAAGTFTPNLSGNGTESIRLSGVGFRAGDLVTVTVEISGPNGVIIGVSSVPFTY